MTDKKHDYWKGNIFGCYGVSSEVTHFTRSRAPPRKVELHLEPKLTPVNENKKITENIKGYSLLNGLYLGVYVNGRHIRLLVDSGCSQVLFTKKTAESLGILSNNAKWSPKKIYKIDKIEWEQQTILPNVSFTLSDGKTLVSDVSVTDNEIDGNIFGAPLLKSLKCVLKYKRNHSCQLYFKSDEETSLMNEVIPHDDFYLKGYFSQDLKEQPLKITVDTGAYCTILGEDFIKKLKKQRGFTGFSGCPSKIRILAKDGLAAIETSSVLLEDNPGTDLCMGRDFFFRYEALIDFDSNLIFFNLDEATYKAEMSSGFFDPSRRQRL